MAAKPQQFLSAQVAPGKANAPCRYKYIFPARIALSSEKETPFQRAGLLKADDECLPLRNIDPYRYTLRRLREGYLYLLEKAGGDLAEFMVTRDGKINGRDWLGIEETLEIFYISFSEWEWDEEFKRAVVKNPGSHMQKITLRPGRRHVGTARQLGELVEEYREKPGKVVSLRGFSQARKLCDSEDVYAGDGEYDHENDSDQRHLKRRWRDAELLFSWSPLKNGAIPEVPCAAAVREKRVFLLAVHDSIGIAREFAALHKASIATLIARNDWYAYLHTIGVYAKTLLEIKPSYGEHLQQDYHVTERRLLGPWLPEHGYAEPPAALKTDIAPPSGDEKISYERLCLQPDIVYEEGDCVWLYTRERRRFSGAAKGKETYVLHPRIDLGPRGAHEGPLDSPAGYRSRLPAGTEGSPYPDFVNGEPRWTLVPYTFKPATWDTPKLNAFFAEHKRAAAIFEEELQLLTNVRAAWLGLGGVHGFIAAMRRGSRSSRRFLTRREAAYAACHAAFTLHDGGKEQADALYFKGNGDAAALFKEVMAGKIAGEAGYVSDDNSLDALIQIFGYQLANLPDAAAKELHDAWDERIYEGMEAADATFSRQRLAEMLIAEGLDAVNETARENNSSPAATAREAAAKPLEFHVRTAILNESKKWILDDIPSRVASRCLALFNAPLREDESEKKLQSAKTFERYMKYLLFVDAAKTALSDHSLVSFLRLGESASSIFALRRAREQAVLATAKGSIASKAGKGLVVFFGKKIVGSYLGLFADLMEGQGLLKKDDYDAAAMTAGTAVVTLALASIAGAFVAVPVGIFGAVLAGYWKNSIDEDWLTHCFWGTYYNKAYKKNSYPVFSYADFFKKLEEEKEPEDEKHNPEPPEEGVNEHSEQQLQWISMMSEPTLATEYFVDASYAPGNPVLDWRRKTLVYVKYAVRFFDPLQSSITAKVSLRTPTGSRDLPLGGEASDIMPVPFRLRLEPPENAAGSESSAGVGGYVQTACLEGVFDIDALEKRIPEPEGPISVFDYNFTPKIHLQMEFAYVPEVIIRKHKGSPEIPLTFLTEEDVSNPAAYNRYKQLQAEMAREAGDAGA